MVKPISREELNIKTIETLKAENQALREHNEELSAKLLPLADIAKAILIQAEQYDKDRADLMKTIRSLTETLISSLEIENKHLHKQISDLTSKLQNLEAENQRLNEVINLNVSTT